MLNNLNFQAFYRVDALKGKMLDFFNVFLKSPILSTKRDILNLILSDCKTDGKNLYFSINKPFKCM